MNRERERRRWWCGWKEKKRKVDDTILGKEKNKVFDVAG
jgi:hypothetical protein